MGRELGRLRAWALPRRQPVGAAGSTVRLSLRANRGARPDVSPDRAARHLGATSAAAAEQRIRHEGRHLRRRVRGLANGRTCAGQGDQSAGHLRRQSERDGGAGERGLERRRSTRFRARSGRACRTQARRQLPRCGRERPDDMARESTHHVLPHRAGRGIERQGGRRSRISLQHGVVVLSRRRRDDGAGEQLRDCGVWRFDHRRNGVDHERRRPLARRAVTAAACRASAAIRSQGRRNTARRNRFPAGRRRCNASSATCSSSRA